MDDSKCDGVIYRKLPAAVGESYVKRVYPAGRVNVKWFGAVGSGGIDDSAAIQRCFDVVGAFSGNLVVEIPSGTYVVTRAINIPGNISVEGAGSSSTSIVFEI